MQDTISANVAAVQARIAAAARRGGRDPSAVTLVAVTKTRSPAEVEAAVRAGVRHLGENRVEEAEHKIPQLRLPGVSWHMVGHLQSRKARQAAGLFDMIQSVDSVRLARKLDALAGERDAPLAVLIEVNVSGEGTKYGFPLSDRPALEAAVAEIAGLRHLCLQGLMTVAFIAQDPEEVRPVFGGLRALRDDFRARFPQVDLRHLSMGMTDDFEVAVEEGATIVRIGRALFGPRM